MPDLSFLKSLGKPIAILGLGVSGAAVAKACLASGVDFAAWDDAADKREAFKDKIVDFSNDLTAYAMLVPAAGIKPTHPVIQKAREQNIPILSDVDLLIQSASDARVIGITGTNGKSTTTALIGHVLQANNIPNAVGGNIGKAACGLPNLGADGVYVLELSSYQLEISAHPACDIAVFLNIAPDHMDWHETLDNYIAAKRKITQPRRDRPKQHLVIGIDTDATAQIAAQLASSQLHAITQISTHQDVMAGRVTVKNGWLHEDDRMLSDLTKHQFLQGAHNHENIAAAYAALRAFGLGPDKILIAIMSFKGLPHRQKRVGQWQHVSFVDDSKATNVDSAARALDTFDNIYWIAGGRPTSEGIDGLEKFYPKIRHAFLIGEAADDFAKKLEGHVPYTVSRTMDVAVSQAFAEARKDSSRPAVVLLATACKSWDQYKNYEQRGDHFAMMTKIMLSKVRA